MATIDLTAILKGIGDDLEESLKSVVKSTALPTELRVRAINWGACVASELAKAGAAKQAGDTAAYDAALREVHLYRKAAEAIATGELMTGLAAGEVEARKRLSELVGLGASIGLKVLAAALV